MNRISLVTPDRRGRSWSRQTVC